MISTWLVLALAGLLAVAGAYLAVRAYGAPHEWSKRWGSLLPVLRLLAVVVLLIAVFNPEIPLPWWREEGSSVVVLDASESMAIRDSTGRSRLDRAVGWITRAHKVVAVDERVRRVSPDSAGALVLTGQSTDIGAMLSLAANAAAADRIIFVSDGGHNSGSDPLPTIRRLGVEISCVHARETGEPVDLSIQSVRAPSLLLPDQTVPIPIRVSYRGAETNVQTSVQLLVDNRKVDEKPVLVAPGASADVMLMYTPTAVGRSEGKIEVEPVPGERITSNNARLFAIDVRKARWITELAFTRASWDLAFLRQSLNEDGGFDTRITVPDLTLQSYGGTAQQTDLLILALYGNREPRSWRPMAEDVLERGGGLVLLGWPTSRIWEDISPLTCTDIGVEEVRLQPTETSLHHPLMLGIVSPDHSAPPLTFPTGPVSSSSRSIILLETSDGRPALAVQPSGNGYVMTWLGADWWRWALLKGVRPDEESRTFWPRALRWLLTPGTRGRLRVHAETENLAVGGGLLVGMEVFSRGWEPAPRGLVSLTLTRADGTDTVATRAVISDGAGIVTFRLPGLGPGQWELSASALLPEGDSLYTHQDLFVPHTTAEMIFTEPDLGLLSRIARETGGTICSPEQQLRLDSLTNASDLVYAPKRIRFRRTPLPFLLLLCLLTAEWWLRQRKGLP